MICRDCECGEPHVCVIAYRRERNLRRVIAWAESQIDAMYEGWT